MNWKLLFSPITRATVDFNVSVAAHLFGSIAFLQMMSENFKVNLHMMAVTSAHSARESLKMLTVR